MTRMKPSKPFSQLPHAGTGLVPFDIEYGLESEDESDEDDIAWARRMQEGRERSKSKVPTSTYQSPLYYTAPEEKKNSYKITRTDKVQPKLKNKSVAKYAFDILLASKTPIHITEIISILRRKKRLGRESSLHHYSIVHHALSRSHFFFRKVDRGMFTVREGFRETKQEKVLGQKKEPNVFDTPGVTELVEAAFNEFMPAKKATASQVFFSLQEIGFTGKFQQVQEALKSRKFRKRKEVFQLR